MSFKISFLLLLSAFLIFAQINDYRRVAQRQIYDRSNKNTYQINRIKTTKVIWTILNPMQSKVVTPCYIALGSIKTIIAKET